MLAHAAWRTQAQHFGSCSRRVDDFRVGIPSSDRALANHPSKTLRGLSDKLVSLNAWAMAEGCTLRDRAR